MNVETTCTELSPAEQAASVCRALGDATRWRVIELLASESRCACELQVAAGVPGNLLAHHLKVLREAGLISRTRRGRWTDYRLEQGALVALAQRLLAVGGGAPRP